MKRLSNTLAALLVIVFLNARPAGAVPAPPADFAVEDVLVNVEQPIGIRFLPDGRMLLLQKKGMVRIVNVGSPIQSDIYMNLADVAHSAGLDSDQERGILDVAVDPNFPTAPYVYLLYTPATGPNGGKLRVARFTHVQNSGGITSRGNLSSELILWQDNDGYDSCCHYGGGLDFGPDGNLWLTTGDHFEGSYAASLQHAGGGVHRFTKTGAIPAENPYVDGAGPNIDSLFAKGLRNPFRARWDLPSNRFFIAEVGGNSQSIAWEDLHVIKYDSATSRFIDEDFGTANDNGQYNGINFGWPTVEGMLPHTNFPGAVIDPNVGEPIFGYKHNNITSAINGGVVYHANQFPLEFQGAYFYADSTRDFIRYLKFSTNGSVVPNPSPNPITDKNPDLISHSFDLSPVGRIVCLEVGPDGALYYVSFTDSGGAYGEPNPNILGAVRRYIYDNGNHRPEISQFSATPPAGSSPLAVDFHIQATDLEGDPMNYVLAFGDGATTGISQALPENSSVTIPHTYLSDGLYQARLEIADALHTVVQTIDVMVGTPPVITSISSTNSRVGSSNTMFRFGDTITFSASATDAEDGLLTGTNFSWEISFIRPGNMHPAFGPLSGTNTINFAIPSQGQGFNDAVYYRCFLTVTDSNGLSTSSSLDIYPEKSKITFNTVPSGIVVQVDGNTAMATPFELNSLINFNHIITVPSIQCVNGTQYNFTSWSNGPTNAYQVYNVPQTNSSLTANYTNSGPCSLVLSGLVVQLEADLNVAVQGENVVGGWLDQSGLGNDLVSGGTPHYGLVQTPSGLPAISLNGAGDKLQRINATSPLGGLPVGNSNRTMFVVAKYNGASAWAGVAYGSGADNQAFGLVVKQGTGELVLHGWAGANDLISTTAGIGAGWLVQSAVLNGGVATHYKDGTQIGQFAHNYNTILSKLVIGEETAGLGYAAMDIAAVLIYNRTLDASERASVESYLRKKYLAAGPVNMAPVVNIGSPGNGTIFTNGTTINFAATATDGEDGDLSSSIQWSSNLNGPIGTGGSFSINTLSIGTHTITASAKDGQNLNGSASVSVRVTSTNAISGLVLSGLVVQLEADLNVAVQGENVVGGWLDQSGLGNDLVSGGTPHYGLVQTPSGLPAISLNGAGDKLQRINATSPLGGLPVGNSNRTMFVVAKYNGASAWAGVAYGSGADNQAFGLVVKQGTGELVLHGWAGANDLISTTAGIGAGWLVQSAVLNGGVATHYKDGTQIGQFAHNYNTILSKLVIGEETAGLGYAAMDIAAVLIYNRTLDASERASVESYLENKYLLITTPTNHAPVVTMQTPTNGTSFTSGATNIFAAMATDVEQGDLSATIQWSSDVDGALGTGASITNTLSTGAHVITASVTDNGSLVGSATVSVSQLTNHAPVVTMQTPTNGTSFTSGATNIFAATATDVEQGDLGATIQWSSDVDGALGTGASITNTLSTGAHMITASVTDNGNLVGSATVSVTQLTNHAPVVTMQAPTNGTSFASGATNIFTATATDVEQGDLSATIQWSSDVDGALGTGASITNTLSTGAHVITASVTDNGSLVGSATVSVSQLTNHAPVVTMEAPTNGTSFTSGATNIFTATATDVEQGDLSATIQWSSDVDGALGTGASITNTLSTGAHVITASVTDNGSLVGSATVSVSQLTNHAPVVTMQTPTNGKTCVASNSIVFTATAEDAEQGDLSPAILWSSDLDGALGTGGCITNTLSAGIHAVTASVVDAGNLVGAMTVSVTQLAAPLDMKLHILGVFTGKVQVKYPDLQPVGNYNLHAVTNLTTQLLSAPENRVHVVTKAEIETMNSTQRSGLIFEYPASADSVFFQIFLEENP